MATRTIPELTDADKKRFWEKVGIKTKDECWEWKAFKNPQGYGNFGIRNKRYISSRVSWNIQNGEIPEGLHVLHKCDNPPCCNPSHLFSGTRKDNMQDMAKKGRDRASTHPETIKRGATHPFNFKPECWFRGEQVHCAKLKSSDVLDIRRLFESGISRFELASKYNVTDRNIWNIVKRKTWRHI